MEVGQRSQPQVEDPFATESPCSTASTVCKQEKQEDALAKADCNGNCNCNRQVIVYKPRQDKDGVAEKEYFDSFPAGYRFCPFDHELIVEYLQRKINNEELPPNQIKHVNLYKHSPKVITERYPELGDKEWYFFTPRDRKYPKGSRPNRAAGTGFWKATGADKAITNNGDLVGFRKTLVFYEGKAPKGEKTNWIMHEYRVSSEPQKRKRNDDVDMRLDDYVLCRIYEKTADKIYKSRRRGACRNYDANFSEDCRDSSFWDNGQNCATDLPEEDYKNVDPFYSNGFYANGEGNQIMEVPPERYGNFPPGYGHFSQVQPVVRQPQVQPLMANVVRQPQVQPVMANVVRHPHFQPPTFMPLNLDVPGYPNENILDEADDYFANMFAPLHPL